MKLFEKRLFVGRRSTRLPYRLSRPPVIESGKTYPLVVFLHGAGERGSDNQAQLKWCVADFAKPEIRERHPCFVLAPQCPKGQKWVDVPWDENRSQPLPAEPSPPMRALIGLFE